MSGEIELVQLVKRYGDVVAVDGIDLHMPGGEFFTLLGPSGCGKTSTLRLIAGFEKLDSGAIRLDGVDMSGKPPHKRPVNTVFQSYALFPHMTVAENVAFGLKYKKLTKAETARRVGEAMELVQLGELATRRPSQLSGGLASARLRAMIDQCLPAPGALRDDWLLWVELWLHAARRPELRPTAARLYARMHEWFGETIAEGVASGEFRVTDADRTIDRLLALIDGYGIRALTDDPAMPIERAREEIWAAVAADLGVTG